MKHGSLREELLTSRIRFGGGRVIDLGTRRGQKRVREGGKEREREREMAIDRGELLRIVLRSCQSGLATRIAINRV